MNEQHEYLFGMFGAGSQKNRLFRSFPLPLCETESSWETIQMKMYFTSTSIIIYIKLIFRPSSDVVLHMSRIECKWEKSFVLPHLHSIRLMWSTASEPGLIRKVVYENLFLNRGTQSLGNNLLRFLKLQCQIIRFLTYQIRCSTSQSIVNLSFI